MTAAEKQLERECEFYRMRAAELEKTEIAAKQIKSIIENAKQRYGDVIWSNCDETTNIPELHKWKALVDLQREIEEMLE